MKSFFLEDESKSKIYVDTGKIQWVSKEPYFKNIENRRCDPLKCPKSPNGKACKSSKTCHFCKHPLNEFGRWNNLFTDTAKNYINSSIVLEKLFYGSEDFITDQYENIGKRVIEENYLVYKQNQTLCFWGEDSGKNRGVVSIAGVRANQANCIITVFKDVNEFSRKIIPAIINLAPNDTVRIKGRESIVLIKPKKKSCNISVQYIASGIQKNHSQMLAKFVGAESNYDLNIELLLKLLAAFEDNLILCKNENTSENQFELLKSYLLYANCKLTHIVFDRIEAQREWNFDNGINCEGYYYNLYKRKHENCLEEFNKLVGENDGLYNHLQNELTNLLSSEIAGLGELVSVDYAYGEDEESDYDDQLYNDILCINILLNKKILDNLHKVETYVTRETDYERSCDDLMLNSVRFRQWDRIINDVW